MNTTASSISDEVFVQPNSNERGTVDEGTEIGIREWEEVQRRQPMEIPKVMFIGAEGE